MYDRTLFDPPQIPTISPQTKLQGNAKFLTSLPPTPLPTSKPKRKRLRLWTEQKGLCAYCDTPLETPNHGTLDHIFPKSKGGHNGKENLKLVCPQCNALKGWFSSFDEAKEFSEKLLRFFENLKQRGIIQ